MVTDRLLHEINLVSLKPTPLISIAVVIPQLWFKLFDGLQAVRGRHDALLRSSRAASCKGVAVWDRGSSETLAPRRAGVDPSTKAVSILSHTQTRRLRPRPRTRTRPSHHNTIQPNTTTGWLFASGSSWTLRHTGGSRQDTHGTPVPEREGRGWPTTCSTRRPPTNDNRRRQALRQTCFQETSAVKRETQQPGADRHLESCKGIGAPRRQGGNLVIRKTESVVCHPPRKGVAYRTKLFFFPRRRTAGLHELTYFLAFFFGRQKFILDGDTLARFLVFGAVVTGLLAPFLIASLGMRHFFPGHRRFSPPTLAGHPFVLKYR